MLYKNVYYTCSTCADAADVCIGEIIAWNRIISNKVRLYANTNFYEMHLYSKCQTQNTLIAYLELHQKQLPATRSCVLYSFYCAFGIVIWKWFGMFERGENKIFLDSHKSLFIINSGLNRLIRFLIRFKRKVSSEVIWQIIPQFNIWMSHVDIELLYIRFA